MGLLQCPRCLKDISATDKVCPWCKTKISLLNEFRYQVEHSRIKLVLLVILALLALGVVWFWRMDGGSKWPLYVVLACVAPLVPWVLKTAYSIASPPEGQGEDAAASLSQDSSPSADGNAPSGTAQVLASPVDYVRSGAALTSSCTAPSAATESPQSK